MCILWAHVYCLGKMNEFSDNMEFRCELENLERKRLMPANREAWEKDKVLNYSFSNSLQGGIKGTSCSEEHFL